MAEIKRQKLIHLHKSTALDASAAAAVAMAKGEIAVRHADNNADSALYTLNNNGDIVTFPSVEKVTSLIRQYKIQYNIDYCIFDYIKLPTSDVNSLNTAQEYQRLGYFTTCLKDMAGICDIPILTACQSNRSDLDNTDPDASCIGGSYRILQLATKLFFLRNKTPTELSEQGYAEGNQVRASATFVYVDWSREVFSICHETQRL